MARVGIEPTTFRFSGGRSYQLSYLAGRHRLSLKPKPLATLTGLEPATSAVTGRRANQLRHRALLNYLRDTRYRVPRRRTPYGIRTRATALKGRRPRPLDEGGRSCSPLGASIAYDRCRANHKSPAQGHKRAILRSSPTRTPRLAFSAPRHVVNSSTPRVTEARAPIAQLVELRTFNPQVPGSSPGGGTIMTRRFAHTAGRFRHSRGVRARRGHFRLGATTHPNG